MKKLFKAFLILIVVALCGSIVIVEAKGITIIRDDNPDGVSVLSIDNENYYIEIDEETNVGYVMQKLNNGEKYESELSHAHGALRPRDGHGRGVCAGGD